MFSYENRRDSNPRGHSLFECPVNIRIANDPKATEMGAEEAACKKRAAGGQLPHGAPNGKHSSKDGCFFQPDSAPQSVIEGHKWHFCVEFYNAFMLIDMLVNGKAASNEQWSYERKKEWYL